MQLPWLQYLTSYCLQLTFDLIYWSIPWVSIKTSIPGFQYSEVLEYIVIHTSLYFLVMVFCSFSGFSVFPSFCSQVCSLPGFSSIVVCFASMLTTTTAATMTLQYLATYYSTPYLGTVLHLGSIPPKIHACLTQYYLSSHDAVSQAVYRWWWVALVLCNVPTLHPINQYSYCCCNLSFNGYKHSNSYTTVPTFHHNCLSNPPGN